MLSLRTLSTRAAFTTRNIHGSPTNCMPRTKSAAADAATSQKAKARKAAKLAVRRPEPLTEEEFMSLLEQDIKGDDTTSLGHYLLQWEREHLRYLRLIEHEMPKLVAFRKPFKPPTSDEPLVIRSIEYMGEHHPAAAKQVIVAPVARLPLRDTEAIHKFKLLAGVNWSEKPPRDAGIGPEEENGEHGYVKISTETFPEQAMNLKWGSDVLDRLIQEANDTAKDGFQDVPIDTRHLDAKVRKAKAGGHARGRGFHRPTLKDFPKEWLPEMEDLVLPAPRTKKNPSLL